MLFGADAVQYNLSFAICSGLFKALALAVVNLVAFVLCPQPADDGQDKC